MRARRSESSAVTSHHSRALLFLPLLLSVGFVLAQAPGCYAQVENQKQPQPDSQIARLGGAAQPSAAGSAAAPATAANGAASPSTSIGDPTIPPAVEKELEALRARIQQLESERKKSDAPADGGSLSAGSSGSATETTPATATTSSVAALDSPQTVREIAPKQPEKPAPAEPFAYADWTWLNGNARNKDVVWDSKFFTPEIRFDTSFVHSFNRPKDDTLGGSTEIFRSNEIQMDQISFGGDFHWQNVRGRLLTMFGMFATTTPRNDASVARGQWDLRDAYRYVSEAWGGYHFNVGHGLNVDAGIFVSYIGLFSYYNFDNWAYQPSYVSSNTPWFFNGVRIQYFPTEKLKIEPWIINGWQSYGKFGSKPGLGGQILWRPKPWVSLVFNNYGMGEDTLGTGNGQFGRSRIHTDDSVEIKYYDHPERTLDKMAFSLTGDLGCEYGGPVTLGLNVNCHHNTATSHKQTFAGWMLYDRMWFKKDLLGLTIGGGVMDNPGRYLALLQPINGADAISGSPYFTANPGDPYKAWDTSITFDYMPKQYITFRSEFGYRHANVPYFTGAGGITPPGGNNGAPASVLAGTTFVPGPELSATPGSTCVAGLTGWCPDLRKDEPSARFAIMVKF
jgi:hypothetical protein